LTDAWGARDVGGVLRATEKMLDRTGDPISRTIPRLVGSLTKHVRNARSARRLEEEGLTAAEAAQRLGMKPYPAQKLYAQVRNFSERDLDDAVIRLAELDHALKGGSRLANELELELALVEMTERD
jgi:DNA polymerase-3 subunit delta